MFTIDADLRDTITLHFRRNKAFAWSEDFFLAQLSEGRSKHDVYWSAIALRDCGTLRSVPALKALANHPMRDVKDCALLTIAQIAGAQETPYYIERLTQGKGNKAYPLWAIGVAADERAIPAIAHYVRKNAKTLAASGVDPREQQEILVFLYRNKATELLKEFAFLAVPLRSLSSISLGQFIRRVPGIQEVVDVGWMSSRAAT